MTLAKRTVAGSMLVAALCLMGQAAAAQDVKTVVKTGSSYDDVKFELSNAIIERGLTVDFGGQIGTMLDRTGADVGSSKPIYKHAEFMAFCSAKLSRQMMEADVDNVGFCPFIVFMYETVAAPGRIVIGYRPPVLRGNDISRKALGEIDKLLAGIVEDAAR
jgi:uncharacterized protein (DUF302 family)